MSALDLFLSRKALAAGVGLTTRRNKVLPPVSPYPAIPARVGVSGRPAEVPLESCLLGPIIETYMTERTWHADTPTIRSSDYIFHIVVKHLKRARCTRNGVGTDSDIDVYFSSPATPASSVLVGGTDTVYEGPYATRTYHLEVLIPIPASGYGAGAQLHMVMERFKGVQMHHNAYEFVWQFARPGSTVLTGTYTGCLNRASNEANIASRTYHATQYGVTQFVLHNNDKLWDLRPADYGGWCGPTNYANGPALTDKGFDSTYNEGGVRIGSMARIAAMGQPWHGLIRMHLSAGVVSSVDITLPDSTVKTLPVGAFYLPAEAARRWLGDTYYFKHPSAPAASTPASVAAVHGVFYNDAIFFGADRGYALNGYNLNPGPYTVGSFDGDWLVVDDAGDVLRSTMISELVSGSNYNLRFKTFGKIRPYDMARAGGGWNRWNTGATPGVISSTDSGVTLPITIHSDIVWSNHPSPTGRNLVVAVEDTDNPDRSKFYEAVIASSGLASSYSQLYAAGLAITPYSVVSDVDPYRYYVNGTRSVDYILFAAYDSSGSLRVARLTCGWQYVPVVHVVTVPYGKHAQSWTTQYGTSGGVPYNNLVPGSEVFIDIEKAVVSINGTDVWTCPEYYEPVIVPMTNNVVGMRYKNESLVERIVFIAPGNVSTDYPWPGSYSVTYNPRTNVLHVSDDASVLLQCA
jgi:hypothetical protein